jgi:hypothetical protein
VDLSGSLEVARGSPAAIVGLSPARPAGSNGRRHVSAMGLAPAPGIPALLLAGRRLGVSSGSLVLPLSAHSSSTRKRARALPPGAGAPSFRVERASTVARSRRAVRRERKGSSIEESDRLHPGSPPLNRARFLPYPAWETRASEFSAEISEISAENSVNIARTSRKNAGANRIAPIPVLADKCLPFLAFAQEPRVNCARMSARNADAIDSHRKI